MKKSLFCFGLGFSGATLAKRLIGEGWQVFGTARTAEKAERLTQDGIQAFVFNDDTPLSEAGLAAMLAAPFVLNSVPTTELGDAVLRHHGTDLQSHPNLTWFGYLSTTVVYGNWDGAWVDETSEAKADSIRGARRLEAEHAWAQLGLPLHVFRLAGIYGPGRNALTSMLKGKARIVDKPGQVFSRIHVADIAGVLAASLARPTAQAGQTDYFNVCDAEPCAPGMVIEHAAELLGMEPPPSIPYDQAELSPMGRSFYQDNKRVDCSKLARVLGYEHQFPTYREGLAHEFLGLKRD